MVRVWLASQKRRVPHTGTTNPRVVTRELAVADGSESEEIIRFVGKNPRGRGVHQVYGLAQATREPWGTGRKGAGGRAAGSSCAAARGERLGELRENRPVPVARKILLQLAAQDIGHLT